MKNLDIIILAAGKGSRMKTSTSKVMHLLAGKPMIQHVVEVAKKLDPANIHVVVGSGSDVLRSHLRTHGVNLVEQKHQRGTGHAVMMAAPNLSAPKTLILYGDVPLISPTTLKQLVENPATISILVATVENAFGYGRILRGGDKKIQRIVEEKDATDIEKSIKEINTGIIAIDTKLLKRLLPELGSNNSQKEYYLTEIISLASQKHEKIGSCCPISSNEIRGINNQQQLSDLERIIQRKKAEELMLDKGARLADPSRIDIRGELTCEEDVFIDVNCVFIGNVNLEKGVTIGPNSVIGDSRIGRGTEVLPFSHIFGSIIGDGCAIGPYARIRPQSEIGDFVKIGNFVEIKKTTVKNGSKINHLSYIGDAKLGEQVNVGAGTITCNFDGNSKHVTVIENRSFIGSNTSLVAPVTIGRETVIGAGSTITKDTEAGKLTLSRSKQITIEGWRKKKVTDIKKRN